MSATYDPLISAIRHNLDSIPIGTLRTLFVDIGREIKSRDNKYSIALLKESEKKTDETKIAIPEVILKKSVGTPLPPNLEEGDIPNLEEENFPYCDLSHHSIIKEHRYDGWPTMWSLISPLHFPFFGRVVISGDVIEIITTTLKFEYPLMDGGYIYHSRWGKAAVKSTENGWFIVDEKYCSQIDDVQQQIKSDTSKDDGPSITFAVSQEKHPDVKELSDKDDYFIYPHLEEIILSIINNDSSSTIQDITTACCHIYLTPPEDEHVEKILQKLDICGYIIPEERAARCTFSITDGGTERLIKYITKTLTDKFDVVDLSYISCLAFNHKLLYFIKRQLRKFVSKNLFNASYQFHQIIRETVRTEM